MKAQEIWPRLLNSPISVVKGYVTLGLLTLLLFAAVIWGIHFQARHIIETIQQTPDDQEAYEELLEFYGSFGFIESARSAFKALAANNPDNPWPLIKLGEIDFFLSIWRGMPKNLEAADQALQVAAGNEAASVELAKFYFDVGEFEKVGQAAKEALKATPDSNKAHYWLGQALKQGGDFEAARQHFETCAMTDRENGDIQSLCFAEIITATREMTLTLNANDLMVQTWANLDASSEETNAFLSLDEPRAMAQQLAWGQTRISPGVSAMSRPILDFYDAATIEGSVISNHGESRPYDFLWFAVYHKYNPPRLAVETLPLTAYTLPTTITVATEGARVISATHPYQNVQGNKLSWQITNLDNITQTLEVVIEPDTFNQWKLPWAASPFGGNMTYYIFAVTTFLGKG